MTPGKPDRAGATRASRTWAAATADARRRKSRRILAASMAASIALHAFVFSLGIAPSAATSPNAGMDPDLPGSRTPFEAPSAIRITRIVARAPATRPESPDTPTEPEREDSPAPEPDDPRPASDVKPREPSPTGRPSLPRASGSTPAARFKPRFTNPALWRRIGDIRADSEPASEIRLRGRGNAEGARYTPSDAWAFDTWTAHDAAGRRWGAAPGVIYLGGFSLQTCQGRFDASNCGFGLPGWRRREYQRFLQAVMEIEEQHRWGGILERGRAIGERRDAQRHPKPDSVPATRDGD